VIASFATRGLREKLELKITVTQDADYQHIISRFENDNSNFLPQYRFSRLAERQIADIYFDNKELRLFQAGHYLRLREERGAKELVFRRLTQDVQYGEVFQEEFVAKGSGEDFVRNWEPIRDWLTSSTGREVKANVADLEDIESVMEATASILPLRSTSCANRGSCSVLMPQPSPIHLRLTLPS
jgi:hypothetical protein